jgi:hypothetical protein
MNKCPSLNKKNPGEGEILRTRPDLPCGPLSLLYNGYRVSFPGVKRPGRGVHHPPTVNAEVKERVELYLYFPSGPSWPVIGWTLPSTLPLPLLSVAMRFCRQSFHKADMDSVVTRTGWYITTKLDVSTIASSSSRRVKKWLLMQRSFMGRANVNVQLSR